MNVYLCNKIKLEVVIDAVVDKVVDKEVTKVAEEVNKELVKEVNEGLVLICTCGDGCWGDHKVDGGHRGDVVLDKEADVEVNQEFDRELADDFIG